MFMLNRCRTHGFMLVLRRTRAGPCIIYYYCSYSPSCQQATNSSKWFAAKKQCRGTRGPEWYRSHLPPWRSPYTYTFSAWVCGMALCGQIDSSRICLVSRWDVKFLCSSSNEKILAIVCSTHSIPHNWHCTFPIDFQFKRLNHTHKLLTICPQLSQALHSLYLLRESFGSLWVYKSLAGNFFE